MTDHKELNAMLTQIHETGLNYKSYADDYNEQVTSLFAYLSGYDPDMTIGEAWDVINNIIRG